MKRICIVCDGYWDQLQGGAEYQLWLMAGALAERGYEVSYIYVDRGVAVSDTPVKLVPLRIARAFKWLFYPYHFLLYFRLQQVLGDLEPDLVLNRVGNGLTGICALFCKRAGIPMAWHVANETDLLPLQIRFSRTMLCAYVDKALLEYGVRNSAHIIAQARYQGDLLSRGYDRTPDLILPNFHPAAEEVPEKPLPVTIIWIANVKPKKGPERFIELARVFAACDDVRFVMVGRAESERYQKTIDAQVDGLDNLEYLGELPIIQVNALLAEADVFVNTSQYEGFPNTFIQAWMREVPVVSLHIDPDDTLKRNKVGFHSVSMEQMVEDVRTLISDKARRREIGVRARRFALDEHGLDANMERLDDFLQAATNAGGAR